MSRRQYTTESPIRRHWRRHTLKRRLRTWIVSSMLFAGLMAALVTHFLFDTTGHGIFGAIVFGLIMYVSATGLSRRLAWPLERIDRVARKISGGDLDARIQAHFYEPIEVRRTGQSINEMADRLVGLVDEQKNLLAAVSHEIRTPLGHLTLLAEQARAAGTADDKLLNELEREISDLDELVGQLLAGSRLDAGTPKLTTLDAVDMARRELQRIGLDPDAMLPVPQAEDLPLLRGLDGDGPPAGQALSADPTLVSRALSNLLRNARDHGGGCTGLEVGKSGSKMLFRVLDRGPGFARATNSSAPTDQSVEKRPTSQSQSWDTKTHLGLGLKLVERIAKAHGGRLTIEQPETGASVVLELPV